VLTLKIKPVIGGQSFSAIESCGWSDPEQRELTLDGWPDGEVADLDVVRLVDGEGDGTGDGQRRYGELGHVRADLLAGLRVVDGVGELGTDVAG
jgi:hypothetical protein